MSLYAKKTFQMFGGEETNVSIVFENELIGVVYDRFGTDIPIIKDDDTHFKCSVKVAVSPVFLSCIISFGNRAKIVSPTEVQEKLKNLIREVDKQYK